MPTLYVICGCNGAGKTTASYTILPEMLQCREFVNSDELARIIAPYNPSHAAIDAGRVMLKRINELTARNIDFAFETTLAVRSYAKLIERTKSKGYTIGIIYFWLSSPELAMSRVNNRVGAGGHNIPWNVIRRRYWAGIDNLFNLYMPLSDYWLIINNSATPSVIVAEGVGPEPRNIFVPEDFEFLKTASQIPHPELDEL